jgi:hypothetical protein
MLLRKRIAIRLLNFERFRRILCKNFVSKAVTHEPTKVAILVHSFDGYKRFQVPCMHFLQKHITSMDDVFLAVEEYRFPCFSSLKVIFTGKGEFSSRMWRAINYLKRCGYTHVLYLQEDMWLNESLSVNVIQDLALKMKMHSVSCLKLGHGSFWPPDHPSIVIVNNQMELGHNVPRFVYYGKFEIPVSHQSSLYEVSFIMRTLWWAVLSGFRSPIEHEDFCSRALKGAVGGNYDERGKVQIGLWKDAPVVHYTHASSIGKLTDEAKHMLRNSGLESLYDETLSGEVFPTSR